MKHKHKWKMIDKTILKSPHTKSLEAGRDISMKRVSLGWFIDRIIYVFQCEECYEIKIEER